MRIGMIAPLEESVPPKGYGGTERVAHLLVQGLVRRGHEVTLFATGDSKTSAHLVSVCPTGLRGSDLTERRKAMLTLALIGKAYELQDSFDIIHDHTEHFGAPTANCAHIPVVMTLHNPALPENKLLFREMKRIHYVGISHSHAETFIPFNLSDIIYHGIPVGEYPFSAEHEGYLLYVGRICEDKGTHYAIQVAETLKLPLIIAAKLNKEDEPYFEKQIRPRLNDRIRWVGEVGSQERNELMSKAICFLHPTNFDEPFGLTLVESMACGCPVVTFKRGSIPEIIEDGKTGFVAVNVEEMIELVRKIDTIDRTHCRHFVEEHFNVERMIDDYEALYERLIQNAYEAKSLAEAREQGAMGNKPEYDQGT